MFIVLKKIKEVIITIKRTKALGYISEQNGGGGGVPPLTEFRSSRGKRQMVYQDPSMKSIANSKRVNAHSSVTLYSV